jgi:hypothetical protein
MPHGMRYDPVIVRAGSIESAVPAPLGLDVSSRMG